MCGIYKITNTLNNKSYIGQSVSIYKRWQQHKDGAKKPHHNSAIHLAMQKYGIDFFEFTVLEECEPSLLNEKEAYWANYYNTYVPNGYNIVLCGQALGTNYMKTVSCYGIDGIRIETWESISVAASDYGVVPNAIHQAIELKTFCKGVRWALGDTERIEPYMYHGEARKSVILYKYNIITFKKEDTIVNARDYAKKVCPSSHERYENGITDSARGLISKYDNSIWSYIDFGSTAPENYQFLNYYTSYKNKDNTPIYSVDIITLEVLSFDETWMAVEYFNLNNAELIKKSMRQNTTVQHRYVFTYNKDDIEQLKISILQGCYNRKSFKAKTAYNIETGESINLNSAASVYIFLTNNNMPLSFLYSIPKQYKQWKFIKYN